MDIIIISINYSHDIATAMLTVCAAVLWILSLRFPFGERGESAALFISIYRRVGRIAEYSLAWILVAGVPRILFYKQYEWTEMAGDLQVVAIIIKHIVMFALVGTGLFYWVKLNRKIRLIAKNDLF